MAVTGLDHINIDTACPERTIAFYSDILGLEDRPADRPDFGFPGAWLWLDQRAVVHLNFLEEEPERATGAPNLTGAFNPTGAFNHIAFEGSGFDATCALLDKNGLDYRTSERAEIDLKQIFVRDPNGVRVEINIRGEF